MKLSKLSLCFLLFASMNSYAHREGNGGDLVICQQPGGGDTYELLDYYEGKNNTAKDVNLPDGDSYLDIAKKIIDSPYGNGTQVTSKDLKKDLLDLIDRFETDMVLTEDDLVDIPDHGEVRIASNCEIKQLVIQYANAEDNTRQYLIDNKIWRFLSEKEKASVVAHEVIYNQAINLGHTDSRQVRAAHFALATRLNKVDFIETLLKGTELIKDCSEGISNKYHNWGATFCVRTYLDTIDNGVSNHIQRLAWLRKFDTVWDINQPIRFTKELLEDLSSTISGIASRKNEALLDILFGSGSNFAQRLYTLFEQTSDIELKMEMIEGFSVLPAERVADSLALSVASQIEEIYAYYFDHNTSNGYGGFSDCNFSEVIFCGEEIIHYEKKFMNPLYAFLALKANTLPEVKDAFLTVVGKLDLNEFGVGIELSYITKRAIETGILDAEFALAILDRIKPEPEDDSDYRFTTSVWVNINKNIQDTQVRDKLIEVYFQQFGRYTVSLGDEIIEYAWRENKADFSVGGMDLVFNTQLMPNISEKLIAGANGLGRVFLSFYLGNMSVVETSSEHQQALSLLVRDIIEEKRYSRLSSTRTIEYGLDKIGELATVPNYIAQEFLNVFFSGEYKKTKNNKLVVKMLDLMLKAENLTQAQKNQVRTLGEIDPREEIRVKALEVYNQL